MWTADGLSFYEGDCRSGDRAATPQEAAPVLLARAKAAKATAIARAFAMAVASGLVWNGKVYQIDETSQARIAARALFARACLNNQETWPVDFGWIAIDNSRPVFTAQQFWDFAKAAQARITALVINARSLKDALLAAQTLADVTAIDETAGWPA